MARYAKSIGFTFSRYVCCVATRLPDRRCIASTVIKCSGEENSGNDLLSPETQGFVKAQTILKQLSIDLHQQQEETPSAAQDGESASEDTSKGKTFAELLQESPIIRLGDFSNQTVTGKIIARVEDELYIDYGGKFDCVCKVPKLKQGDQSTTSSREDGYHVGADVILKVKDHEMSARFMGYNTDMTLLEADATLVGLQFSKKKEPTITEL